MSTNTKHAKYSPSQLARIIACPGSVAMSEGIEQLPTSPYAAEGTMLHGFMEQYLDTGIMPDVRTDYKVLLEKCMDYIQPSSNKQVPYTLSCISCHALRLM